MLLMLSHSIIMALMKRRKRESQARTMPSQAGSKASCWADDMEQETGGIYLEPELTDKNMHEFTDGEWKMGTQ